MWLCGTCGASTPSECKCQTPKPVTQPVQTPIEDEIAALKAVGAALAAIGPDARPRVLRWAIRAGDRRGVGR